MHPLKLQKTSMYRDPKEFVSAKLSNKKTIFGNKKVMGLVCHQCGIEGVISKLQPAHSCVKCKYDICSACYKSSDRLINSQDIEKYKDSDYIQ